jgi:hypothetical protein
MDARSARVPGARRSLYWGSHGSSTSCHYDNLRAMTWSTTIRGTKRWLLFSCRDLLPGTPLQAVHHYQLFVAIVYLLTS